WPVDRTPVPGGVRIMRNGKEPELASLNDEALQLIREGRAIDQFFEPSTLDKTSTGVRLSVWVEGLTTKEQACLGERRVGMYPGGGDSRRAGRYWG
ncbi:MAG TPA: hypothetical protein VH092_32320, partial [Urbifossiella sp.]|nr:hypothetical protein [Urbifossiella sp.]